MTARSAIHASREPAGDTVVRAVAAARTRLRLVSTLRLVAMAGPCGVAAGAALALAGWGPAGMAAALGALGAAAATIWGAAHTPPPATVARILDAHLDLKDRVAATLQLHDTSSPVAALVARDAAVRLAGINLAALFPIRIDRAAAIATAVAVALAAWLAASGTDTGRAAARATAAGNMSEGSEATRTGGAPKTAAADASAQVTGRRSTVTVREPRDPARGRDEAQDAATVARPGTAAGTRPRAGDSPSGSSATAARRSHAGSAPSDAAGTGARSGIGGSAAGRTPGGALSAGAGGSAPGSALATVDHRTVTQPSASSYNAARAGAEAALARDVIPPDYRDHVRAYFRALSSGETSSGGQR